MSDEFIITIHNLDNLGNLSNLDAIVTSSLFRLLGIKYSTNNSNNSNNYHHENNEKIFDQLFFHGSDANAENQRIGNLNFSDSSFDQLKSLISNFTNHDRLKLFSGSLKENLISKEYYETQAWRYQIKPLKNWCKHSIFNRLPNDPLEKINEIEKLPLPKPLKRFLEEDLAQEASQIHSPRH